MFFRQLYGYPRCLCCGLILSTVGMLDLLGTGDAGGVTMTVFPARRVAPKRVRLAKLLRSSLGLDRPFMVLLLRYSLR